MASLQITLRAGSGDDLDAIMCVFDDAVAWLVANGRSAQWGSEPWSIDESKVDFIRKMVERGTTLLAEDEGTIVGATIFSPDRIAYAPAVDEPEMYIHLLIASPTTRGGGVGGKLLEAVRVETIRRGISLLRVDCWAGGDRKLVAYYERAGFTPTVEVPVRDTSVQVFEQHLQLSKT